jgi:hypothetical protein
MTSFDLGAVVRRDTLAFVPGKRPTLRAETADGLPLLLVGGRTVVEIFAPSAVYGLHNGLPALRQTRRRIARVQRLCPAKTPWPECPQAFLDEALAALDHAAGSRLAQALDAIQGILRARLLEAGCTDAIESGGVLKIHAGGGTFEWTDTSQRPIRRQSLEIHDPRIPAVAEGLRLPTGSGTLAKMQTCILPVLPLTAHERLRIADAGPASAALDALLAKQAAADRRCGKRLKAGPSSCL